MQAKEATRRMFAVVYRQVILDNILPPIVHLKQMLQSKRHPLTKDVMLVIKHMAQNNRGDLDAFLASNRQLKTEIEYDLKKMEVGFLTET